MQFNHQNKKNLQIQIKKKQRTKNKKQKSRENQSNWCKNYDANTQDYDYIKYKIIYTYIQVKIFKNI